MASNPFDTFAPSADANPFDKHADITKNVFDTGLDTAKGVGSKVLDLLGRTGDAGMAFAATPGDWNPRNIPGEFAQAGKNAAHAFRVGMPADVRQADRDKVKTDFGIKGAIDKLPGGFPRGVADTLVDAAVDPATGLGGGGLVERGANALGRGAFIGAARAAEKAPTLGRAMDFVAPGGAKLGALKRSLAANEGGAGLDKYTLGRAAVKGANNAGTDVNAALDEAFQTKAPSYTAKPSAPKPKPKLTLAEVQAAGRHRLAPEIHGPATLNSSPYAISPQKAARFKGSPVGGSFFDAPKNITVTPGESNVPAGMKDAFMPPAPGTPSFLGDLSKKLTRGTTSAMFAIPQLPGLPGHGSNIAQLGLASDPATALAATGRFFGSGEALPFSGLRSKVQNLPGVSGLKSAQDASLARATKTGATTVHPEDFGKDASFLDKIPVVGALARESGRTLGGYDDAMKSALNDKWTKAYLQQGYTPAMAAAKASERVGQDVIDYSDKSDLTRAAQHVLPFATFATKKPGVVARAAVRHPERILAATRNNPNFSSDRDKPMDDPDAGRPLASIFNALNNKSPGAKGAPGLPGAQYVRASAGAPLKDLLGALGANYFTYGSPAAHAGGDAAKGWLKLLLSQTLGNVPGGDEVIKRAGLDYFGGK